MRWWLLFLAGCQCGQPRPTEIVAPEASHFGRFHGLVHAAVRADVEGSKWIARSLQEGDVPEVADDDGGAEKVGGALGFIQMAEDSYEVVDGVAAAAVGCGKCHTAAGVEPPPMGPWSHENAGLRMVLGAAFPPAQRPEGDVAELQAVRLAFDGADTHEEQVSAGLAACLACHENR